MGKTILENEQIEIVEKKSKFIANIQYVTSVEDAEEALKEIKKKYRDARHHCFAFRVMQENNIIERMSDDGEPSGTAGGPMLNILSKNDLINVIVVVTRYFGGILLGTGGLVKAYSTATLNCLEKASFVSEEPGYVIEWQIPYTDIEKLKYFCKKEKINILEMKYEKNVKVYVEISNIIKNEILRKLEENEKIQFIGDKCKIIDEKMVRKYI